jgi:arabinofuranosyltransferase
MTSPLQFLQLRVSRFDPWGLLSVGAPVLISALVAVAVLSVAWISDDALITFRYALNVVSGNGPVFNVGERVQGYTHPLWFILMTAAMFIYRDPVWISTVAGLFLVLALSWSSA